MEIGAIRDIKRVMAILCVLGAGGASAAYTYGRAIWHPVYASVMGVRSVNDVIDRYGNDSRDRMRPSYASAGIAYPPRKVAFIALKNERLMEVWARGEDQWMQVHTYPITAASGVAGPKLREGDRQVPEGIYDIIGLNPNSSYHLSMKLNYPNAFDLQHAQAEGRDEPGTNIFIHGKAVSIGCLAMGDEAIEELFTLVHDVGRGNVTVVIAPSDPRKHPLIPADKHPAWTADLYDQIAEAIDDIAGDAR